MIGAPDISAKAAPAPGPAMDPAEALRLENQLCFPLYACAKEMVRRYGPLLEHLDLTYTQYICMMALWERDGITVRELGERLHLDSGTLTPLLKKLEARGLVARMRSPEDERCLAVVLTDAGRAMRDEAAAVPGQMMCELPLTAGEAEALAKLLWTLLARYDGESAGESLV